MWGGLRRLGSGAAAAALQDSHAVLAGGGGGGSAASGDVALRAVSSSLRQLHGAAGDGARTQGHAIPAPAGQQGQTEAVGGGTWDATAGRARGFAAEPRSMRDDTQRPRPDSRGGRGAARAAPDSNGDGPSRPKPRFLLERLGLAEPQQQQQQQEQRGRGGFTRPPRPFGRPDAGTGPPRPNGRHSGGGPQQQRFQPHYQQQQQQQQRGPDGRPQWGRPQGEQQQQQQGDRPPRPGPNNWRQGGGGSGGQRGSGGYSNQGRYHGQQQQQQQQGNGQGQQQGQGQGYARPADRQHRQGPGGGFNGGPARRPDSAFGSMPWRQQQAAPGQQPQPQGQQPWQQGGQQPWQQGQQQPWQQQQGGQQQQPWQRFFPGGVPTEFPSAFPRAQPGQQGQNQGQHGGKRKGGRPGGQQSAAMAAAVQDELPEEVVIPEDVTVLRLAQLLGEPLEKVESVLSDLGETISGRHDLVSPDYAELAALEFGKLAVIDASSSGRRGRADGDAVPRPAVVTVMGHVDHGKTTLLDALRKTSVAAGEAGGITQHIGAFEVQMPGSQQSLTFLDTPGHAAFSSMRARGAAVTDLVVLVVAADDGLMPQTREAMSHAKAAGCPIVVAITKCDRPSAQPERVRRQLLAAGLELEEAGGSVQVVEVSGVTGQGLDQLEEALLLQAELMELKASRSRRAEGVVIEARMEKGQGPVVTVIVKRGTLKVGQPLVVGTEWGRVRSLRGTGGKAATEVLPGQPAEISGLKGLPDAGDQLMVLDSEERAQLISRARTSRSEFHRHAATARLVATEQQRLAAAASANERNGEGGGGEQQQQQRVLPVIIKADVQGSAEAVKEAVEHLCTEHVNVQVVHVGVGPVSQSDVQLAVPLGAKVLGFNVRPSGADVEALAKQHDVEVLCQRVIYGLLEDVSSLLLGASPKLPEEVVAGSADVLQVFPLKGNRGKPGGVVAGCRVTDGSIRGSLRYRVLRDGEVVHTGPCSSLKRHKLEVEAVGKGAECGVLLEDFNDFKQGDVLECITVEMRASGKVQQSKPAPDWGASHKTS